MTTETKNPAVITAAEFVADGYAAKVAAGDVIARGTTGERVTRIRASNDPDWELEAFYPDEISSKVWWGLTGDCPIDLEWLYPTDDATPATDELASLRAANARYRSALEAIKSAALNYSQDQQNNSDGSNMAFVVGRLSGLGFTGEIARAALAETELKS
jgi:hypothetical protein